MAKDICYWLVRRLNVIGEHQYFCVSATGETDVTENPKRAMRWFMREGAEQAADRLGWNWVAVQVKFPGDEPAY
jgi:hypothetical protein